MAVRGLQSAVPPGACSSPGSCRQPNRDGPEGSAVDRWWSERRGRMQLVGRRGTAAEK